MTKRETNHPSDETFLDEMADKCERLKAAMGASPAVYEPGRYYSELLDNLLRLVALARRPDPVSLVAGDQLTTSLAQFQRRVAVRIAEEQARTNPDNAVIDLWCESIRLAREFVALARRAPALTPEHTLVQIDWCISHYDRNDAALEMLRAYRKLVAQLHAPAPPEARP